MAWTIEYGGQFQGREETAGFGDHQLVQGLRSCGHNDGKMNLKTYLI